jgi:hypothetical protein
MPRKDGHTPQPQRRHHRPMHSGRKGKGLGKRIRLAKMNKVQTR